MNDKKLTPKQALEWIEKVYIPWYNQVTGPQTQDDDGPGSNPPPPPPPGPIKP